MPFKKMFFFGAIGVINTAVDWSAFWALGQVLPKTDLAVWSAKAMSYGLGVICSYLLNASITFRQQVMHLRGSGLCSHSALLRRFVVVSLVCLLLNSFTYAALAGDQHLALVPLIVATVITFMVGFSLNHLWTFRQGRVV